MALRRRVKLIDQVGIVAILAGAIWLALTRVLGCPHAPALAISVLIAGIKLGMYLRSRVRPLRVGPVRISLTGARGTGRASRARRPSSRRTSRSGSGGRSK